MESSNQPLDLEKELTCSICTELLFQPLTLLDCIHTFCGACLKEWFTFQAAKAEKSPEPPTPDSTIFTCPSCRAIVRDTKHNATVGNLLDMFVAANPDKARTEEDKEQMRQKYTPGEQVLPKVQRRERSVEERRAEEEDRRLMDQVRDMSLREATGASSLTPPTSRRRRGSHSGDDRPRSSRDRSGSSRSARPRDGGWRSNGEEDARRSTDQLHAESRRRRRRSSSQQRQVEHQASLRSLISSADMSDQDIQKEIEEFARQIQEEGLLDGLDLDNIDLSRDDELSRRITESYRRRQRERARQEGSRRNNANGHSSSSRSSETTQSDSRQRVADGNGRTGNRPRPQGRSASGSQQDDRSRPPTSTSGSVDPREPPPRSRRRTASHGRSETLPSLSIANSGTQQGSRSQTDLTLRPQTSDSPSSRPQLPEIRSISTSAVPAKEDAAHSLYPAPLFSSPIAGSDYSFANRAQLGPNQGSQGSQSANASPVTPPEVPARSAARPYGPSDLAAVYSAVSSPLSHVPAGIQHPRTRTHLYPEPSITCSQCGRGHIEYEVHYNCSVCASGQWTICIDCYRAGKGCNYWFGFGYGAWSRWEKSRPKSDGSRAPPHMLTAGRYLAPPSTPGGADGRRTLTTDDPQLRKETGTFCSKCMAWTNDCYWRCDVCNEGDWGFCNNCVNQGKSCSHMLLPLAHEETQSPSRANHHRPSGRPPSATILTGPQASSIGPFKPLTFSTRCDVCQDPILPTQVRHHCYSCTSSLVQNGTPGDYDICVTCYKSLAAKGHISAENGPNGWRRCLNGHRMAIVGFTMGKYGQWRYIERDLVGGRALRIEPFSSPDYAGPPLLKYQWRKGEDKVDRLVTKDVTISAPTTIGSLTFEQEFPPDGGSGDKGAAKWAWYPAPGTDNELMFPKGAGISEIKDVNGDWFYGTYMGAKGLFPGPYVRLESPE